MTLILHTYLPAATAGVRADWGVFAIDRCDAPSMSRGIATPH